MIDPSKIPEEEKTALVTDLLHTIQALRADVQRLRDEVARLKGQKGKPKVPPSRLEKDPKDKEEKKKQKQKDRKRPGSKKRSKTKNLHIHETIQVPPKNLPVGSIRTGHTPWVVQGIKLELYNVCYELEIWTTPAGEVIKAELPESINGHFNQTLRSFALQQYYHGHVTHPLIREELLEIGVDISTGQINRILTEQNEDFHLEKKGVLAAGLEVSDYINVDDTGARHAGKNGYCTHIGNEFFAWFESTGSKSRINFLQLLRNGHSDYVINDDALWHIKNQRFPQRFLTQLAEDNAKHFDTEAKWMSHLNKLGIEKDRHVRIATEGALLGSVMHHGFSQKMVILSDDAGQFNILLHALCWIHAERTIHKLIPCSQEESKAIEDMRDLIWQFYRDLKAYKDAPDEQTKIDLRKRFDDIFATETCSVVLNAALRRVARNKDELLLVLERPEIPLHNNASENDIREYVKKRKISGSTRSDNGRRCRDTFTSLKKTCRKLGVSFWSYLNDRISKAGEIPPLPDLIRERARSA